MENNSIFLKFKKKCISYYEKNPYYNIEPEDLLNIIEFILEFNLEVKEEIKAEETENTEKVVENKEKVENTEKVEIKGVTKEQIKEIININEESIKETVQEVVKVETNIFNRVLEKMIKSFKIPIDELTKAIFIDINNKIQKEINMYESELTDQFKDLNCIKIIIGAIVLLLSVNNTNKESFVKIQAVKTHFIKRIFEFTNYETKSLIFYFKIFSSAITWTAINFCVLQAMIPDSLIKLALTALFLEKSDVVIGRIAYENEGFYDNYISQEIGLINKKYNIEKYNKHITKTLEVIGLKDDAIKQINLDTIVKDLKIVNEKDKEIVKENVKDIVVENFNELVKVTDKKEKTYLNIVNEDLNKFITQFVEVEKLNCFDMDRVLDFFLNDKM